MAPRYLRSPEMTQRSGFRCFLCGDLVRYAIDPSGGIVALECRACSMTMRVELADPLDLGYPPEPQHYRPCAVRKGELHCLNCDATLVRNLTGSAFAYDHTCRICKSRIEVAVQPLTHSTGARLSASVARLLRPATPASSGLST